MAYKLICYLLSKYYPKVHQNILNIHTMWFGKLGNWDSKLKHSWKSHMLNQWIFIQHLLWGKHCSNHWTLTKNRHVDLCNSFWNLINTVERTAIISKLLAFVASSILRPYLPYYLSFFFLPTWNIYWHYTQNPFLPHHKVPGPEVRPLCPISETRS